MTQRIKWKTIILVLIAILLAWTLTALLLGWSTLPQESGIVHKPAN